MPRTGRTLSLSRDEVAHAALAIADAEGIEALSMRRLAGDLGVGTMTLYGYVRSKQELVDAAVDAAAEDFEAAPPDGTVRERARKYLLGVRRWIDRHPWLVELSANTALGRPSMISLSENCMRLLLDAGLPPDDAARSFRLILSYAFGSAAFCTNEADDEDVRRMRGALAALPADQFPALAATAEAHIGALGGEAVFLYGLERLFDGIDARLQQLGLPRLD
jgi:AcrR family transcriptional regulator